MSLGKVEEGKLGQLAEAISKHKKLGFDFKEVIFTQLCSRFVKPVSKLAIYDNWIGRMYPGMIEHDTAVQQHLTKLLRKSELLQSSKAIDSGIIKKRSLTVKVAMDELNQVMAVPVRVRKETIWLRTNIPPNACKLFNALGANCPCLFYPILPLLHSYLRGQGSLIN